jgi:TPR repeat protein
VRWFRKAAEQGHVNAQCCLGFSYDNGQGAKEDHALALGWYRKVAEQGDADAQYYLGAKFLKGDGVKRDLTESACWFHLAADQGELNAAAELDKVLRAGATSELELELELILSSVDTAIPLIYQGVSMRVCSNCGIAAAEGSGGIALKPCSR